MAFLAEDGTGLELANSLCDVAFADNYFLERGITKWAGLTADKESALIRATDYLENRFGPLFIGDKLVALQALSFPRVTLATTIFPVAVKRATCEYAVRTFGALGAVLLPDPEIHASGQGLDRVREKVGPLEQEVRFQYQGPGSVRLLIRPYPAADMLLRGLLRSIGCGVIRG